ncbi:hypothetical protein [Butyrivibrio sp. AE2032]|uniref:hypothetical protein n=1 Tax=Butyrivibrio sp. AE2032 TaxID=1458463 RepID=UPI00054D8073|nr:hypothetical protein [Butyrivibrio sp. AE2032]
MKKKIVITVLFIVSIVALVLIGYIIVFPQPARQGIPIDEITGIYSSAKLKQGCNITHGTYFPEDGVFSHAYERYIENEDQGLPVSDIRIIDVYGFNCSVVFIYAENQQLYIAEDYPLSNLDYNAIEVISANDLMKADLPTNYTLNGAPSEHLPRILIILIPVLVLAVFVALHIRMLKKKYQRERYEE